MTPILNGKVAVVTGGGSGIGASIVRRLAQAGAVVAILDRDLEQAQRLENELHSSKLHVHAIAADVANAIEVNDAFDKVATTFGSPDILVSNAGIGLQKAFIETSLEEWNRILEVNLTGTFLCGQAAARLMIKRRYGRIINISSGAGLRGVPGRCAYGASKGGVILLTKVMAAELGDFGITVNSVAPGPIDTPLTAKMHTNETRAAYLNATPLRRYGQLNELADSVLFMASDASAYITGHTLEVDGGMASSGPLFALTPVSGTPSSSADQGAA